MSELTSFDLEGGGQIYVQTIEECQSVAPDDVAGRTTRIANRGEEIANKSSKLFHKSLENLRPLSNSILNTLKSIDNKPSQVQVEFAVTLGTEGSLIVASANAEANFKVVLVWQDKNETKTDRSRE